MSEISSNTSAFKLKGRLYTLTVMQILDKDLAALEAQLKLTIQQAPRLFQHIPLILDCTALPADDLSLPALCHLLKQYHMIPVALQNASPQLAELAQHHGLALIATQSNLDKPIPSSSPITSYVPTLCHQVPVRSGQQLVAKNTDLLVVASVSKGAELLSDGNIYVYGTLRGRALAGMNGNRSARIFCQALDAELIAIAGVYRLSESMTHHHGPCSIYLADDRIMIDTLAKK